MGTLAEVTVGIVTLAILVRAVEEVGVVVLPATPARPIAHLQTERS